MDHRRIVAGFVAVSAITGLVAYALEAHAAGAPSIAMILWGSAAFFTDLSNLVVAFAFGWLAARGVSRGAHRWIGFAVTLMLVLLAGYFGFLGGAEGFGTRGVADTMAHGVTPLVAILVWALFLRGGGLLWRDAAVWPLPVLGYFGYALIRGRASGQYAYGFIDVLEVGLTKVALIVVAFAVATLVFGMLVVAIDRMGSNAMRERRVVS